MFYRNGSGATITATTSGTSNVSWQVWINNQPPPESDPPAMLVTPAPRGPKPPLSAYEQWRRQDEVLVEAEFTDLP